MSKRILQQITRHKEARPEHGAESGSNDDNDTPYASSVATTSRSKSVPTLHDKHTTPQKTTFKATKRSQQQDHLTDSDPTSPKHSKVLNNDTTDSSDEEPITLPIRNNNTTPAMFFNSVTPSIPMPEYSIDKNIRHFLTDMGAYLSCLHHTVDDAQKAYLVLSAVKGDAKDILLGYADEQIDTLEKIFQVLLREFKKPEKCVVN